MRRRTRARPCSRSAASTEGNVDQVLQAERSRVCVVRAIAEAADPERAARALRNLIDAGAATAAPLSGERAELARAELAPLAEGERPAALGVAVVVAVVLGAGVLIGALTVQTCPSAGARCPEPSS